jgi:hypothetical protein
MYTDRATLWSHYQDVYTNVFIPVPCAFNTICFIITYSSLEDRKVNSSNIFESSQYLDNLAMITMICAGPEKYREHGNNVPRKATLWQEERGLSHEVPGRCFFAATAAN